MALGLINAKGFWLAKTLVWGLKSRRGCTGLISRCTLLALQHMWVVWRALPVDGAHRGLHVGCHSCAARTLAFIQARMCAVQRLPPLRASHGPDCA